MTLRIEFGSEAEAEEFFKSFSPDFNELEPKLNGKCVMIKLEERPTRVRAIANSVLRMVNLFEEISDFLRT
ncbi:MAG: hypothetical protein NZ992_06130 [Candidatus Korarchaeum sp.]|nr:hypothetical protein [Candidatus Korarchaeum sp.]MDW8036149.1 hypothetical protein [Candidatus Korarchaeum sp.]